VQLEVANTRRGRLCVEQEANGDLKSRSGAGRKGRAACFLDVMSVLSAPMLPQLQNRGKKTPNSGRAGCLLSSSERWWGGGWCRVSSVIAGGFGSAAAGFAWDRLGP